MLERAPDAYPNLRRMVDDGAGMHFDSDARFAQGLEWMLDGVAAWLARRAADA